MQGLRLIPAYSGEQALELDITAQNRLVLRAFDIYTISIKAPLLSGGSIQV